MGQVGSRNRPVSTWDSLGTGKRFRYNYKVTIIRSLFTYFITKMHGRPKWLEIFYGGNLGSLNYEIATVKHFPIKETKIESELMASKWYDYRQLHYIQATYYFVKCYTDAYQDYYRKSINVEAAPYVRCLKANNFLDAKEKATIFRLRQLVDLLGMPYEFFLRFTMDWHHKMVSEKGIVYPPRPCHLLSDKDMIGDVVLAWEARCEVSLQVATDPSYRTSQFNGDASIYANQLKHEAFVIDQIRNRKHPKFALAAALYRYDVVRIEEALRQFDARTVSEAVDEFFVS